MFAVGLPGLALLLLRANMAALLYSESGVRLGQLAMHWTAPIFVTAGLSLLVGILTPVVGLLVALLELACILVAGQGAQPAAVLPIAAALTLATVGPGGYSLDARLFGRRLIVRA
jgi:uncharacterized membrane protein YphA (DoxX/SURF4 family)